MLDKFNLPAHTHTHTVLLAVCVLTDQKELSLKSWHWHATIMLSWKYRVFVWFGNVFQGLTRPRVCLCTLVCWLASLSLMSSALIWMQQQHLLCTLSSPCFFWFYIIFAGTFPEQSFKSRVSSPYNQQWMIPIACCLFYSRTKGLIRNLATTWNIFLKPLPVSLGC